jgi:hypothetical protein
MSYALPRVLEHFGGLGYRFERIGDAVSLGGLSIFGFSFLVSRCFVFLLFSGAEKIGDVCI